VDGSDYSEGSGDDSDADADGGTGPKPLPKSKSKSTLGKRKAEFSSRKPKRTYFPLSARLCVIVACTGGPRIEVEYENETEVAPRTRVAAGW
jgi:hypothetical protein